MKEVFALREADERDAEFLEVPIDDKFLEESGEFRALGDTVADTL